MNLNLNSVAAACVIAFAGCSGCSSGGGAAPVAPPVPPASSPVVLVAVKCPNGIEQQVTNTPEAIAAAKAACTVVTGTPSPLEGSTTASPVELAAGIEVPFNGKLASATAVLWQGAVGIGTQVLGIASISSDGMKVNFVSAIRLAYGPAFKLVVTGTDSVGRAVTTTLSFATAARSCDGFSSKPATFSAELQTCISPSGGQTIANPVYNRTTDGSCTMAVGKPLSAACKAYLANGTVIVVETLAPVAGHQAYWLAYLGKDGGGVLSLLDMVTGNVVGTTTLPSISWIFGNPYGASVNDGSKTHLATWDGTKIVLACMVGC